MENSSIMKQARVMTMNDGVAGREAACLDSSAIVALAVPDDMHHDDTVRVCRAAVRSGYLLIASPLAIMEAVAAIRKKFTSLRRRRSGSEKETAGVEAEAGMAVAHMHKVVNGMVNQKHLKVVELAGWSPDFPVLCDEMNKHEGSVTCSAKSRTYRHRGIGSHDPPHYSIAKDVGAPIIITSDAAFADIEGKGGEFGHVRIRTTGGPLIGLLGGGAAGGQSSGA